MQPAHGRLVQGGTSWKLEVKGDKGAETVEAKNVIIATGSKPRHLPGVPVDNKLVCDNEGALSFGAVPGRLGVVGAGVIGLEYATIFATLGVRVTLIDQRRELLSFVDSEVIDTLVHQMRQSRMTLRLGEAVCGLELTEGPKGPRVHIRLESGKHISTERALYSVGRSGATGALNLAAAGPAPDERGRLTGNGEFQTGVSDSDAVGDGIGLPSLASLSMEQGRLAACHAFGQHCESVPELFPYGIYTIPEISVVGQSEEALTQAGVPYEVGKAFYREIARGQISGDSTGMLKLMCHAETRKLLGVAILGEGASDRIHSGQAVLAHGGSVDYFINTVFNYPTLAECYKTAAFDGVNRLE